MLAAILDSFAPGSASLGGVKKDIWRYELLHVLVPTLKQDFTQQPQGWLTASKLAHILWLVLGGIMTERAVVMFNAGIETSKQTHQHSLGSIQGKHNQK
jgi:hypothetical protein